MDNSTGDKISADLGMWNFGEGVEKKFDSHVRKSVPGYDLSHQLVSLLSDPFIKKGSKIVDLGCSTGTLDRILFDRHRKKDPEIIGIDNQANMLKKAAELSKGYPIKYLNEDLTNYKMPKAIDLIISFYTLQFISPAVRQELVNKIYNSLNWGGGFFLFEKVRAPDARFQDYINHGFMNYKLNNFSANEVIGKANSLIGVLEPFSTLGNTEMLKRAGFKDICTISKFLCFEGFLAIK